MIVNKFKAIREYELNMTQIELAKILGVHSSTISGWENRKDLISIKRLIEFANLFNYSLDYIFGLVPKNVLFDKIYVDLPSLAKNLKTLRIMNNMTQEQVAKKLNTNQNNYTHYETGINIIPTSFLYDLTKIYKPFSIDELFDRKRIK